MLAGFFHIFKLQICCAFCVVSHLLVSWQRNSDSMDIQTRMKKLQQSIAMLSVVPSVSELFEIVVYLCKHSFLLYLGIVHRKEQTEMCLL